MILTSYLTFSSPYLYHCHPCFLFKSASLTCWLTGNFWGWHNLQPVFPPNLFDWQTSWPAFLFWVSIGPGTCGLTRTVTYMLFCFIFLHLHHGAWNFSPKSQFLIGIVSDILSGILSGIYSDILSNILSDILSSILSGIYSDILSAIYSDILSGNLSGMAFSLACVHSLLSLQYGGRVQASPTAFGAGDMGASAASAASEEEERMEEEEKAKKEGGRKEGREGGREGGEGRKEGRKEMHFVKI